MSIEDMAKEAIYNQIINRAPAADAEELIQLAKAYATIHFGPDGGRVIRQDEWDIDEDDEEAETK